MKATCEECQKRPATIEVEVNGKPVAMCESCRKWWAEDSKPAPIQAGKYGSTRYRGRHYSTAVRWWEGRK